MLSLYFPDDPCLADLYCQGIAIHLYKRMGFHYKTSKHSEVIERNTLVSSAVLRKNSGWAEGMVVLKGEIKAGASGSEQSWSIPNVAHTKVCFLIPFQRLLGRAN